MLSFLQFLLIDNILFLIPTNPSDPHRKNQTSITEQQIPWQCDYAFDNKTKLSMPNSMTRINTIKSILWKIKYSSQLHACDGSNNTYLEKLIPSGSYPSRFSCTQRLKARTCRQVSSEILCRWLF